MSPREAAVGALEAALGHVFADRTLLEEALTHASAARGPGRGKDNERLEFIGDRVLGLAIARALYARQPDADAGLLSKQFTHLVSREACAQVGRSVGLGEALRLQGGAGARAGREHPTILADACEALIAALFLELGFEGAAERILAIWAPLLDAPFDRTASDPKTVLQEWAAASGRPTPAYVLLERSGPDHRPRFTVEVRLGEATKASGTGASLQAAQKAAAAALLSADRAGG